MNARREDVAMGVGPQPVALVSAGLRVGLGHELSGNRTAPELVNEVEMARIVLYVVEHQQRYWQRANGSRAEVATELGDDPTDHHDGFRGRGTR
jgi:hypothetical protein